MVDNKYPVKKEIIHSKNAEDGIEMIEEILSILKQFKNDEGEEAKIIYRGVSKDYTKRSNQPYSFIRSGAAVRLDRGQKWNYTYSTYMLYIRGLITDVKKNYPENYASWKDLEILGDLQHNGAGTCLVDFSRNMLISLWFACGETEEKSDGKLYCYNVNDDLIRRNSLKIIKETDLRKPIEKLLVETKHTTNYCSDTDYSFFMWTPSNLNNRIARQDSVFIFGLPKFNIAEHSVLEITIPSNCKTKIREALAFYFDVKDTSIFNDRHGFATVNDKSTPYPQKEKMYVQGLEEMFKGNYKTALDFFIMEENGLDSNKVILSLEDNLKIAEIHLSKAICYKYINENDYAEKDKYANNAIREFSQARNHYYKALEKADKNDDEWKSIYARKLLRTLNEEIQLLYKKREYQRCIMSCDKAIDSIKKLRKKGIYDFRNTEAKRDFKDVYCKLSKLELLLLIIFQEGKMSDDNKDRWNRFIESAKKRKNEMSEFDAMLLSFFEKIWEGIVICNKNNEKILNIKTLEDEFDRTFNSKKKDSVPYSSWDFTEIKEALSQNKILNDPIKISLLELTAHMISIRDRYNIKELNTHINN